MIGIDVTRGCDDECVRKLDGAMSSTNSGRQHGDLEVQRLDIDGDALDEATNGSHSCGSPTGWSDQDLGKDVGFALGHHSARTIRVCDEAFANLDAGCSQCVRR